jgi:demethylmenaquinone methyltransferase/2-methoxy-6-polyprenyl-1,4-benzoquinol methylase
VSKSPRPKEAHFKSSPHSGVEIAHRFFFGTASSYDLAVHFWTVGLDWWWKKRLIDKIPSVPQCILDQGCGTGILTFRMARRFPSCRVIGVELHHEYISLAAKKARALGLNNVQLILGRAEEVVLGERFDCITSSYLCKYAEMEELIKGAKKMLREGGHLIVHDFTYPRNRLAARILGIYFRFMQTFGRRGFPHWEKAFYELETFIRQSRWVPELITSLEGQGFRSIRVERLTLGIATIVSAKNIN